MVSSLEAAERVKLIDKSNVDVLVSMRTERKRKMEQDAAYVFN